MSIIDFYKTSDDYSHSLAAQFNDKKQQLQKQYLNQKKIIDAANIINATSNMSIEEMENNIASQVNISELNIGDLDEETVAIERTLYTAIRNNNSKQFSEALKDLIKLKNNLINGENWRLTEDTSQIFNLQALTLEKLQQEGNIANQIGRMGEILAQFQMAKVADALISSLKAKGQCNLGLFQVKMEDTGQTKAHSISGLGTRDVNIQTDSRLTVSDGHVSYTFNFSDKSSGRFVTKGMKAKINAKLRQSTIGSFVNSFGMRNEILNTMSLHRNEKDAAIPENYVLLSEARSQAQLAMGAFLFAALVEEEKMTGEGTLIKDAINFTIVGGRLIPEENILNKLYDRFQNNRLKASVEGVSKKIILEQRDAANWRSPDDAEGYFLGRAITLMQSI